MFPKREISKFTACGVLQNVKISKTSFWGPPQARKILCIWDVGFLVKIPPCFATSNNKGGFLPNIPDPRYPIFFSPAAGFRSLFLLLSRFVARRRRKILTFHASETQFYLRKSMFYCQNTKIFASRRSLSDRSQDVAKQGGIFTKGGIFTRNTTDRYVKNLQKTLPRYRISCISSKNPPLRKNSPLVSQHLEICLRGSAGRRTFWYFGSNTSIF